MAAKSMSFLFMLGLIALAGAARPGPPASRRLSQSAGGTWSGWNPSALLAIPSTGNAASAFSSASASSSGGRTATSLTQATGGGSALAASMTSTNGGGALRSMPTLQAQQPSQLFGALLRPQQWQAAQPHQGQPTQQQDATAQDAGSDEPPGTGTGPAGFMADILNLHNTLRARHGTAALAWDASLASASQSWADRCVFQHSNGGGENLAQYYNTPIEGVQAWYDEINLYNYVNGDYSEATGHATQMLWQSSTTLGCGYTASCKLLVCRYAPPGNVIGRFQENVLPPTGSQ